MSKKKKSSQPANNVPESPYPPEVFPVMEAYLQAESKDERIDALMTIAQMVQLEVDTSWIEVPPALVSLMEDLEAAYIKYENLCIELGKFVVEDLILYKNQQASGKGSAPKKPIDPNLN